ncbi:MAG: lysophospholipase [Thermoleophilia bacterium]|nr:lysophospholipase [Thermoleophilia bacterium]
MTLHPLVILLLAVAIPLLVLGVFLVYIALRYGPLISRIFEEKPLFLPLRVAREEGGEDVQFTTADGLRLTGTYYRNTGEGRLGVVVFCHEYLSDRFSCQPYTEDLRRRGYDVFSFDFRSHGASDAEPSYKPLQWVTDHELRDLQAALGYLRTRPDRDPAGFALFGVSRGGGVALVVGAEEPDVWGVVTDGAFPTRGMMLAYIVRWAEIYVSAKFLYRNVPKSLYRLAARSGRVRSERRLNCRYPDVERAVGRLAPRPWLMIHGEKDAYIAPAIARELFDRGRQPKEFWLIPGAKHNRGLQTDPAKYHAKLADFFGRFAPRVHPERTPAPARTAAPPVVAIPTPTLDPASSQLAPALPG